MLRFAAPADETIGRFFRDDRRWGSRDRELVGDVVYAVLRRLGTLREAVAESAKVAHPESTKLALHESVKLALHESVKLALLAWPEAHHARLERDLAPEVIDWLRVAQALARSA